MFSEYASRFLAQSQSRLLSSQTDQSPHRNPLERPRGNASRASSRGYLSAQPFGNPYQGTGGQASRFPFASRLSTASTQAPLFHSATDEFREEDDQEEHEREVADFYALQQSRRDFGASRLNESSESEGEAEKRRRRETKRRPQGIRSSWTGEEETAKDKEANAAKNHGKRRSIFDSVASSVAGRGKGRLVDVDLESTIEEDDEDEVYGDEDPDDDPPSVQKFRRPPPIKGDFPTSTFLPRETDLEAARANPRPPSPGTDSILPSLDVSPPDPPRHDIFWNRLFVICLASVFATYTLVWLHTTAPGRGTALGDTVYTTVHASFYLLAVDTLVAVIVAFVWLATLRSFVRPLVLCILVAVPIMCFSFTLYPFISSFQGTWHGTSLQDRAMRWLSAVPALFAIIWTYTAYKSRNSLGRAIELLEFSSKILAANPALILVGFATLVMVVVWSWIWMLMFTRVFLEGHFDSGRSRFLIDTSTWWLGIFFVLMYLWTLGILSGIQRTTTAATVSQWYFHRLVVPAPSSHRVVRASFDHSITTIFGTICYSTLLALAIRLPLLVLPRRLSGFLATAFYTLIPTSIATLTNPLTLTYSAIHSQPLATAARGLADLNFISTTSPTTTLTPSAAASPSSSSSNLQPYRLAKLLLHATRFITALAFGFGGWVSTARLLRLSQAEASNPVSGAIQSYRGSLYAYIVGLIAGAIGWAVLGAMEGVLGGILDAVVVCWGSETGRGREGRSGAVYCREAGELLGEDGGVGL